MKFPSFKKKTGAEKVKKEKPKKEKKVKAPKAAGGKPSRTRTLVLVLVLVVLGGAGAAFYLGLIPGLPEPAPQAPLTQKVKRQPIAKPKTTAAAKKPIPKAPQTAKKRTVPAKPVKSTEKQVVEEKISKKSVASVPKKTAVANKKTVADKAAVADKKPTVTAKKTVSPVAEKPVVSSAKGNYTVTVGTYLGSGSVKKAQSKISRLGFKPIVSNVRKTVKMTRLRTGAYPDKQAAAMRVRQLKSIAADSFYLKIGSEYRVYVGSFRNIDNARRFADKLYTQGVLLEEETVSLKKTLKQVSFGSFVDNKSAEKAAAKARKAGLEAVVSKRR